MVIASVTTKIANRHACAQPIHSQAPEWVNVQVSQPTATRSSHQPISEMLLPVT